MQSQKNKAGCDAIYLKQNFLQLFTSAPETYSIEKSMLPCWYGLKSPAFI